MKTEQQLREEFNEFIIRIRFHILNSQEHSIAKDIATEYFTETTDDLFNWIQQQIAEAKIEELESIELPTAEYEDPDVITYRELVEGMIKEKLTELQK